MVRAALTTLSRAPAVPAAGPIEVSRTPAAGRGHGRRNPSRPDTWWRDVSTTPLALPRPTPALPLTCVDVDKFRTRAMRWL
jgi:hypothetical protein